MLNGKTSTSSYTHKHSAELWLLFRARAKGIKVYDVSVVYVKEDLRFCCELQHFTCEGCQQHSSEVPKHLAREASALIAPFLLSGFHAER